MGDVLEKRKLEDEDSDVFFHEILIPPKKVQKEIEAKKSASIG